MQAAILRFSSGGGVPRGLHATARWSAHVNPGEAGTTVIDFLCPNGHRIRCPADQAGQAAKCPRCGVKFRVPSAEEIEMDESISDGWRRWPRGLICRRRPPAARRPQAAAAAKEPQIEFLCPNGHHLHGPASLQGRPGACPECGSRFRIPVIDEAQEGAGRSRSSCLSVPVGGDETGSATAKLAQAAAAGPPARHPSGTASDIAAATRRRRSAQSSWRASRPATRRPPQGHPLAELLAQLWAAKGEQSKVELRLAGGDTLAPESFVKGLSRGSTASSASRPTTATGR